MTRSHSASSISAVVVGASTIPALLKAKSSRPKASTVPSRAAFTSSDRLTSHATDVVSERPSAGLFDHAGRFPVVLL